jgi:hypothetical protein
MTAQYVVKNHVNEGTEPPPRSPELSSLDEGKNPSSNFALHSGHQDHHNQQSINPYHHIIHVHGQKSNSNRVLTEFISLS